MHTYASTKKMQLCISWSQQEPLPLTALHAGPSTDSITSQCFLGNVVRASCLSRTGCKLKQTQKGGRGFNWKIVAWKLRTDLIWRNERWRERDWKKKKREKRVENRKTRKKPNHPFIVQVLQSFFPGAQPDLHLPRLGDVGLPVNDAPVAPAPAHGERVKVQRLAVGGALHRAEHATELLPRPGGAVGAHALEEGWYFPAGRHASGAGGGAAGSFSRGGWCGRHRGSGSQLLVFVWTATAFCRVPSAGGRTVTKSAGKSVRLMLHENTPTVEREGRWCEEILFSVYEQQTVLNCLLMSLN